MKMKQETSHNQHGSATVEATIVFPLFFLLVFAIFDFCSVFYQQSAYTDALRKIAHEVALEGSIPDENAPEWATWKVQHVEAPFYASLPAHMVGSIRSFAPITGTLQDQDGNSLGCGIKLVLEADVSCLTCSAIHTADASNNQPATAGVPITISTVVMSEASIPCSSTPL